MVGDNGFSDRVREVLSDPTNLPAELLSFIPQHVTQNPVSVKTMHAPVFDVRDYGATGDGVTDDTVAIQSAANAAAVAGGIMAFAEGKSYLLSTYITIGSKTTVRGNEATLKLGPAYVSGSQGQGHFYCTGQSDITFDGIRFDGSSGTLAHDAANNFAIWILNSPRVTVQNCYAANVNANGSNANAVFLWVGTSHYGKAFGNTIENVNGGVLFSQGQNTLFVGNSCINANDVGIVFNGSGSFNNVAVANTVKGIPAQCAFGVENGTSRWTIIGNTIQNCFGALDINDASYAGTVQPGGVFGHNIVTDLDKGASAQTFTCGVLYRTTKSRDIKIDSNVFSGLTPYGSTDAFIFVSSATVDRLEITHNIFESQNVAIPAGIIFTSAGSSISRLRIIDNRIWSTGANAIGSAIWFANSPTIDTTDIARNTFENCGNGVRFDTPTVTGLTLVDNNPIAAVTNTYNGSRWGTITPANTVVPHILTHGNGVSRSVWRANASPAGGTWDQSDQVWSTVVAAGGIPGWICTTGGTPGTWKAMAAVAP